MYFDKIYILTKPVKNPSFDKRRKYGPESIEVLKEGSFIFSHTWADQPTIRTYCNEQGNRLSSGVDPLAKAIAEAVVEYDGPLKWRHIWVKNFGQLYDFHLEETITDLLNTGAIEVSQLIRSARAVDAKFQAEDQAVLK